MKTHRPTWPFVSIAASALLSASVFAAKIPDCGVNKPSTNLPKPPAQSEYDAYRTAKATATAGPAGNTVFNNAENRLPAAGADQVYYEYYLGFDGSGAAGSHRAVLLVLTPKNGGKRQLVQRYYTMDHYATFCSLTS